MPLFLYLAWHAPHFPFQPVATPEIAQRYARNASFAPDERRHRLGMITELDRGVARVIDALRARGGDATLDETLIVFVSDNGAPGGIRGAVDARGAPYPNNLPLIGHKGSLFEVR